MRTMSARAHRVLLWTLGLVTGIFLMVGDELINFAQCCRDQLYPFPLIGSYTVWQSWEITFAVIVISVLAALALMTETLQPCSCCQRNRGAPAADTPDSRRG